MAVDDSSLLPETPPPRPARREAAIEAALRRFEGIEDMPVGAERPSSASRWAWGRHPQFGLLVSASLIAVIGLPAALIAIRNGDVTSEQEPAPSAPVTMNFSQEGVAAETQFEGPPMPDGVAETPSEQPSARTAQQAVEMRQTRSPPPAIALAAPPPAAPAPAAPMIAQKAEPTADAIVTTGSRIRRPELSSADSFELSRAEPLAERAGNAPAAPERVLKDPSYRTFLSRLQSAVRANDRSAVVKLIAFPLRVNSDGGSKLYRDAISVREDYERIFTPRVRQAILDQRFEQLFGRDQGVMIGNGTVWFDHVCSNSKCSPPGPVRITTINP